MKLKSKVRILYKEKYSYRSKIGGWRTSVYIVLLAQYIISILYNLDNKREAEKICTEWKQKFPESNRF
jgi:hypothetical protein